MHGLCLTAVLFAAFLARAAVGSESRSQDTKGKK